MANTFRVIAEYNGYDPHLEKKLDAIRGHEGCGTHLLTNVRDHSWARKTRRGAEQLAAKLRRFKKLKKVTIQPDEYDD